MKTLVLASRNAHKAQEFQALLGPLGYDVLTASQAGYDGDPEETGTTFRENALIKAQAVSEGTGGIHPVLSDDSGLEVEGLEDAPGVYSARYAGPGASDADNRKKLLADLASEPDREARFVCVLCLLLPGAEPEYFEGECSGKIAEGERGGNGFGYDPLFIPAGEARTFGEMTAAEKNPMSHRGKAVAALVKFLGVR